MVHELWFRIAVFASLGLGAGFCSGMFGIGGGILRIPVFIALLPEFGVHPDVLMHVTVATSVALVLPTAVVATYKQARLGNFDPQFYWAWAVGLAIGVIAGMLAVPYLSTKDLQAVFAGFLLLLAFYMGFGKPSWVIRKRPLAPIGRAALGTFVGALSAVTGTGGGALTTPVLKAFSTELRRAIATASATGLVVGSFGTVAFIVQGQHVLGRPPNSLGYVDLVVAGAMLPTTLIGTPWGVKANAWLSKTTLTRIYTVFLFVLGVHMVLKVLGIP